MIKRTRNIHYPQSRTDLCPICFRHTEYQTTKLQTPTHNIWETKLYLEYERLYQHHIALRTNQRAAFLAQVESLEVGHSVIVADYKENILLPIELHQISTSFYDRTAITCLTFLCYFRHAKEESPTKYAVTFLSSYLNHHATFTLHCFKELLKLPIFQNVTNVSVWSDGGRHFRSLEYLRAILDNPLPSQSIQFDVNYFAPAHGKSEVDSVFGLFTHVLNHRLEKSIDTIDGLLLALSRECMRFTATSHYRSTSYLFLRFVPFFKSVVTVSLLIYLIRTENPEEKIEVESLEMKDFLKFFHFEKHGCYIHRSKFSTRGIAEIDVIRYRPCVVKVNRQTREIKKQKPTMDAMEQIKTSMITDSDTLKRSGAVPERRNKKKPS